MDDDIGGQMADREWCADCGLHQVECGCDYE